jgi:hypothetical protein
LLARAKRGKRKDCFGRSSVAFVSLSPLTFSLL